MSHCDHHDEQKSARRLLAAFGVIVVFMVVEVIGGVLSHSLALLADATHMFTDAVALGLAASAHYIAGRPADAKRHFGYRRAQVLAAFSNGILLVVLLGWIVYEAIKRAFFEPLAVDWKPMLVVAILGFGANAVAYLVLHNAGAKDVNVRGAMLHVASDLLGSVAAIVAAVVIATTKWMPIDPILSIVVAILIGRSAYKLMRETGHILLEGAPQGINVGRLTEGLKAAAPGVENVHDVFIWQITPEQTRLTLHARINDAARAEATLNQIKTYLEKEYGIRESTVQIEVGSNCPDCDEDHAHSPMPQQTVAFGRHLHHNHQHEHDHAHGVLAHNHK